MDKLLGKLLEQPDIYADFEFLAFWQTQYNNMNAVNLFFAWIKVNTHLLSKISWPEFIYVSNLTKNKAYT